MNAIIQALEALCRAVPGAIGLSVHLYDSYVHVDFVAASDDAAVAIGEALNIKVRFSNNDSHRWMSGTCTSDGLYLTVRGPHHECVAVPALDPDAVKAAVAQAEAALGDGKAA